MLKKDLDYYFAQLCRIEKHREEKAEKEIRKLYKQMLKEMRQFVAEEYYQLAEDGKLTFDILRSKGQDARFLQEVEERLGGLSTKVSNEIKQTVEDVYKLAYDGIRDAVNKSKDVSELQEILQMLDSNTAQMMWATVDNSTMEIALDKNHRNIVWDIKQAVSTALRNGDRFDTMAKSIMDKVNNNYNKAVLIARTEVHRVREAGHLESAKGLNDALKESSVDVRMVKKWKTMKDGAVRPQSRYKTKSGWKTAKKRPNAPDHQKMHNVVVELGEPFDLGNGVKAMAPGQSGVAGHDCNCRCTLLYLLMDDEMFFKATGKHFEGYEKNENSDNSLEENFKSGRIELGKTDSLPMSVYFNRLEPIYERAKKVQPIDGFEDIFIHGDATGFAVNDASGNLAESYTPREFAEVLRNDPNYHGGNIRLCSCGTGADDAISAAALARQLGVDVLAPSNTLWIDIDGTMTIGDNFTDNDGEWILFKGRD